jgi:LysM repeat protein
MKPHTLPTKRQPASKGIFKRLSAITGNRKQRVAATANPADLEIDETGSKISRALTIIFLIHIVAIGLIFVHKQFLDGRPSDGLTVAKVAANMIEVAPAPQRELNLPKFSSTDDRYLVQLGDNYARIAQAHGVEEADLRACNNDVKIGPGLRLHIPPKRIIAVEPPEVVAIRESAPTDHERGLVEVDVSDAPRAQLVRPNTHVEKNSAAEPVAASGKSYVVQKGDNIWQIANRFKVDQEKLMKANNITDARKVKIGTNLVIPR